MSADPPPYNQIYITAWTILSIVLGIIFFGAFVLCKDLLAAGHIVWNLLRYLASPLI
jgi:hypothetical protein